MTEARPASIEERLRDTANGDVMPLSVSGLLLTAASEIHQLKEALRETSDFLAGSQDYIDAKWERSGKKPPIGVRYVQGKVRDAVARARVLLSPQGTKR